MVTLRVNGKCDNMTLNTKEEEEERTAVEDKVEEEEDVKSTIINDFSEFATFFNENPNIETRVREIIDYHLTDGVNDKTYESIKTGLQILLGETAGVFTIAALRINNNMFFNRFEMIEGIDVVKPLLFIRHLTALYGSIITDAHSLIGEISDDWADGSITLYCKGENEAWFIDVSLNKYNKEKIFLRLPPGSASNLAQGLIREMGKMPTDAVKNETIERFRAETEVFKEKFLV